jgi:hypothetical protein
LFFLINEALNSLVVEYKNGDDLDQIIRSATAALTNA